MILSITLDMDKTNVIHLLYMWKALSCMVLFCNSQENEDFTIYSISLQYFNFRTLSWAILKNVIIFYIRKLTFMQVANSTFNTKIKTEINCLQMTTHSCLQQQLFLNIETINM